MKDSCIISHFSVHYPLWYETTFLNNVCIYYVLYKFAKKMIDGICSKNEQTSHDFFDKLFESRF